MHLSEAEKKRLIAQAKWGDLELPPSIRPLHIDEGNRLRRGYCNRPYRDKESNVEVSCIVIAESQDRLFDLFLQFANRLQAYTTGLIQVLLESPHDSQDDSHKDFWADKQDVFVLPSLLSPWQEYFLEDGCVGIAISARNLPMEIQLTEHKLILVYPGSVERFWHCVGLLRSRGLPEIQDMWLLPDGEHMHSSSEDLAAQFRELCRILGAEPD